MWSRYLKKQHKEQIIKDIQRVANEMYDTRNSSMLTSGICKNCGHMIVFKDTLCPKCKSKMMKDKARMIKKSIME